MAGQRPAGCERVSSTRTGQAGRAPSARAFEDDRVQAASGLLPARGHDDASVAKESLGVHHRPYAEHGGGAAMARQVTALDVQDTVAVQDRLPTLRVPARIMWV